MNWETPNLLHGALGTAVLIGNVDVLNGVLVVVDDLKDLLKGASKKLWKSALPWG